MKSHSYEKTRGAGVPSTSALTSGLAASVGPSDDADSAKLNDPNAADTQPHVGDPEAALCGHIDGQGRRCRMLVASMDSDLCVYHTQRQLQAQRGRETATAELLACAEHLNDAESVFRFLSTLVRQVTLKRIPRRDAVTLAYISQLLLNSLGAGYREAMFQLETERVEALAAAKRPPKIIWDLPHPPYEPDDPVEPGSRQNR